MTDTTLTLNSGSGGSDLAGDDDATTGFHQYTKLKFGDSNTFTHVTSADGLPVNIVQDSLAGLTVNLSAVDNAVLDQIDTNTDPLANLHSSDYDTGAGTDTTTAIGLAIPSNSGAVEVSSTNPLPIDVQFGSAQAATNTGNSNANTMRVVLATDQPAITANLSATDNAVLDDIAASVAGTLAVSNAGLTELAAAINGSSQLDVNIAANALNSSTIADDAAFTLTSSYLTAVGGIRDDSLSTLSAVEGDAVPLRVSSTGALHVTGGGGGTEYTEDVATANPIVGTATMMERDDALSTVTPIEGDWIGLRGTAEGALWTQDFNSDTMVTHLATLAGAVSGTEVQVDLVSANVTNAGTFAVQAAQSGTWTLGANSGVDIGDVDVTSISAGSNLIGDVGISGARTSGGTTIFRSIDLDETEEEVKASAGQVYWMHVMNMAATVRYLKFYNATAASVTVGTTTPVLTFPIPTLATTNGAGFVLAIPNGIAFSTAICVAATTGLADNDTGAPGASEVIINLGYA